MHEEISVDQAIDDGLAKIDPVNWDDMTRAEDYHLWDKNLKAAAEVSLMLSKPLLLTGDPGVGKSEFSRWLAYQLGYGKREKFVVKSTTEARDLFYQFDTLARFHDAQMSNSGDGIKETHNPENVDPLAYTTYNALGLAILYSVGLDRARSKGFVSDRMPEKFLAAFPEQPRRTVVLIDEIDKAQRDVPNDILDEIDQMAFTFRENCNRSIKADSKMPPVVVITSNSERDLPEPFLRRCIYYHIPFPENDEALTKIVLSRLRTRMAEDSPLMRDAQAMLKYLRRDELQLVHKPGPAELLDWLYVLTQETTYLASRLEKHPQAYIAARTTLLKHAQDQELAEKNWKQWMKDAGLTTHNQ